MRITILGISFPQTILLQVIRGTNSDQGLTGSNQRRKSRGFGAVDRRCGSIFMAAV